MKLTEQQRKHFGKFADEIQELLFEAHDEGRDAGYDDGYDTGYCDGQDAAE